MTKPRKLKLTDKPTGHTFGKLNLKDVRVTDGALCEGGYSADDWHDDEHPLNRSDERRPNGCEDQ